MRPGASIASRMLSKRSDPNNQMKIENDHGLLVYSDKGEKRCLGYLLDLSGIGVFDSYFGKVEISPDDARRHNDLLDDATLLGLDQNCKVGQGGMFYWSDKPLQVETFLGTLVSDRVEKNGHSITFHRNGMTFRGREQRDADCFIFRRVK